MLWNAVHFIENTLKEDPSVDIYWGGHGPVLHGVKVLFFVFIKFYMLMVVSGCHAGLTAAIMVFGQMMALVIF